MSYNYEAEKLKIPDFALESYYINKKIVEANKKKELFDFALKMQESENKI